jgi:hypothetical protein
MSEQEVRFCHHCLDRLGRAHSATISVSGRVKVLAQDGRANLVIDHDSERIAAHSHHSSPSLLIPALILSVGWSRPALALECGDCNDFLKPTISPAKVGAGWRRIES